MSNSSGAVTIVAFSPECSVKMNSSKRTWFRTSYKWTIRCRRRKKLRGVERLAISRNDQPAAYKQPRFRQMHGRHAAKQALEQLSGSQAPSWKR